jgi:capsular polysaccharide transport system permease protein
MSQQALHSTQPDGRSTDASAVPSVRPGTSPSTRTLRLATAADAAHARPARRGINLSLLSFLLMVVVPFLLAVAYYGFIATDQFVTEARFAVRTLVISEQKSDQNNNVNTVTRMPTATLSSQDQYVVMSFINSPEIIARLNTKVDVASFFEGQDVDPLSAMPKNPTTEEFFDYWRRQVITVLDAPSGIVTLEVRAFTPDKAQALAKLIIEESESLANELSVRARADYTARAQTEVDRSRQRYEASLEKLNAFQNQSKIFSPELQATENGQLLLAMMKQRLDFDARLESLEQANSASSPTYRQLKRQREALVGQIEDLRNKMAATETQDQNLSSYLREFMALDTERTVAVALYQAARRNLDTAQAEALRKGVYVSTFVNPDRAQESRYPRRVVTPLLMLLGLVLIWGTGKLILASIDDHRI